MKIAIASDHAGFCQKPAMVEYLKSLGHEVIDFGPQSADRVDYPDFADKVARCVAAGNADRGVLICGTGIGMALTADKVAGVRAAVIQSAAKIHSALRQGHQRAELFFFHHSCTSHLTGNPSWKGVPESAHPQSQPYRVPLQKP